jgi:hypothetical protein
MDTSLLEIITKLRLFIGFLGEKDQFNWWASSFFSSSSNAFLDPIFRRTQLLAKCNGVTQAATLVHDEHIGVGHVYHLFRLPEDLEQGLHQFLYGKELQSIFSADTTSDLLLEKLASLSDSNLKSVQGPIRVGNIEDLYAVEKWKRTAGFYEDGFQQGKNAYPYYSDVS